MEEKKYLNFFNKFGYGTGDFAANMVYGLVSSFVMIYLTNTVGMNAGIIGTLILISKLLDGVTDIFFGNLIDRTHSKMGKARPWMLWSYVGNAIALVAVFAIPEKMGDSAKYAYFFITYTLLNAVFYTANNISYSALTSLITKNPNERVQMGTFRFIGSTLGTTLVSNLTLVLVDRFGGGAVGWKWTAVFFAVVGLIINTFSVFSVKELPEEELNEGRVKEQVPAEKVSLVETLKTLVANKYFNMLTILYVLFYMMMGISMGAAVYYFLYNCGDPNWFGKMVTASSVGSIVGLVVAPWLVQKFKSIRTVNLGAFLINFVVRVIFLVLAIKFKAPALVIVFGFVALTMCTCGGTFNALVSEASNYTFYKTGKRLDGSMYSCTSFGMKVGGGLGSAISGWLLAASHFDAAALVQPAECSKMLTFMFAGVPLIITAIIILIYWKLDVEKVNKELRAQQNA